MTSPFKSRRRRPLVLLALVGAAVLIAFAVGWHTLVNTRAAAQAATKTASYLATGPVATTRAAGAPASTSRTGVRTLALQAEFGRQAALILGCNELVRYHPRTFADVVASASDTVKIIGLVSSGEELDIARSLLQKYNIDESAIHFIMLPLDSMWVRDYGPFFARRSDGEVVVLDPEYSQVDDAAERKEDDKVPRTLAKLMGLPVHPVPLRLEGGNIVTNGEGVVVSTLGLRRRNTDHGYELPQIGSLLGEHMGARSWIYLRELDGEPTSHADMFVNFLASDVCVVGQYDAAHDPVNAAILDEAAAVLARQTTSKGPMQVHRIPMPPRTDAHWRTYTNVIFANGTLLVPWYSSVDPALQQKAMDLYASLLPGWKIEPVRCDTLAPKRGLLHCVSLNVPDFVLIDKLLASPSSVMLKD